MRERALVDFVRPARSLAVTAKRSVIRRSRCRARSSERRVFAETLAFSVTVAPAASVVLTGAVRRSFTTAAAPSFLLALEIRNVPRAVMSQICWQETRRPTTPVVHGRWRAAALTFTPGPPPLAPPPGAPGATGIVAPGPPADGGATQSPLWARR